MFNRSRSGRSTYGIVGLGRFGYALAMELAEAGADILVLDADEEKVRELREYTENAYVIKSLDKKSLAETGIQDCDVAVVCIGERLDTSILTTLSLVSLGIPTVISKAATAEHGLILEKLGAEVVYPERDMAIRLARRLEAAKMLDYVTLSERVNISKLLVPDRMIGRTVVEANLRRAFGVNIIAIENGNTVTEVILPDYVFKKGDIMYVSGSKDGLNRLSEWTNQR